MYSELLRLSFSQAATWPADAHMFLLSIRELAFLWGRGGGSDALETPNSSNVCSLFVKTNSNLKFKHERKTNFVFSA